MFERLRKLLGARTEAKEEWRPAPSCEIYMRNDAVYVFTGRHTHEGFTTAGEPVCRLAAQPDARELGNAVQDALVASAASAPVSLDDEGFVSRTTGMQSWTALERGSRHIAVRVEGDSLHVGSMRPVGGGWESDASRMVEVGSPELLGQALLNVATSALPRGAARVRRPPGYAKATVPPGEDIPCPFGYKIWWLTVASADPRRVAESLKLKDLRACSWVDGHAAAERKFMELAYVTPSTEGWVFVLYARVPENEKDLRALLERLSAEFGEAQAYANVRTSNAYLWARAEAGKLTRAFCDGDGEVRIDFGTRTDDEIELGIGVADDRDHRTREDDVLSMAERWSINPLELGDQETFGSGLLGRK